MPSEPTRTGRTILAMEMFAIPTDKKLGANKSLRAEKRRSTFRGATRLTAEPLAGSQTRANMAEQNEGESALESSKYEDSEAEHEGRPDLHKCAEEFSHFCQVDVSKEVKTTVPFSELHFSSSSLFDIQYRFCSFHLKKEGIESVIEDMLVRLDEFSHLADTVRENHKMCMLHMRDGEPLAVPTELDLCPLSAKPFRTQAQWGSVKVRRIAKETAAIIGEERCFGLASHTCSGREWMQSVWPSIVSLTSLSGVARQFWDRYVRVVLLTPELQHYRTTLQRAACNFWNHIPFQESEGTKFQHHTLINYDTEWSVPDPKWFHPKLHSSATTTQYTMSADARVVQENWPFGGNSFVWTFLKISQLKLWYRIQQTDSVIGLGNHWSVCSYSQGTPVWSFVCFTFIYVEETYDSHICTHVALVFFWALDNLTFSLVLMSLDFNQIFQQVLCGLFIPGFCKQSEKECWWNGGEG